MRDSNSKDKCLRDEEIACYVDGLVAPGLRKRIEDHLERCGLCLHHVAEVKRLVAPEALFGAVLPAGALARAENLVAEAIRGVPQFDVVLALKSGICRLLETTGDLLAPGGQAPVAVRGGKCPGDASSAGTDGSAGLKVAKRLSGYLVTLEVAAEGEGVVPRVGIVEETSSARPDGIKARLHSPETSETRYSRQGRISFSALKPGSYGIEIEEIGRIGLEIQ